MLHFQRILNLFDLLKKKSFFLLGPRATGKSYLIKEQLKDRAIILDLLRSDIFLKLASEPWDLEAIIEAEMLKKQIDIIVIDEIQKIPDLLDEVQRLIENKKWRFLLTGSSARKLKRGNANLLAGRAWMSHLHPLSYSEIPQFDLDRYLQFGGLPAVYASNDPVEELMSYVRLYLYEEIQAESLVRKLQAFSRFLTVSALTNGQILNFAKIANDTSIPASTVKEYYTILQDTMIGFLLNPWLHSKKRKAIATAKFYIFDIGVCHTLAQTKTLDKNSDLYGRSFEHWIALELRSYISYRRRQEEMYFWRSTHHQEVDFIIGDHTAIEVKATRKVITDDLKGLRALQEEGIIKQFILVSNDKIETHADNILCLHWLTFIERLWSDKIF